MQTSHVHASEQLLFFTLLQLLIIVLAGRLGGSAAQKLGQARVVGEIVVGILLGPSLFGLLAPAAFGLVFRSTPPLPLDLLSQVGLLLLMFQIGLEFEFSHLGERRNRRAVLGVALAGIAVPFVLGLGFAPLVPAAYAGPASSAQSFALFFATALSITALPVLGRLLMEFGLTRAPLGVIAISAAAINDVAGWLCLALVTTLASAPFDGGRFGLRVAAVLAFAAVCWWGVRPLLARWVESRVERDGELSGQVMGVVLAGIFAGGMATYELGIFAVFGGFMLGVLLHDRARFAAAWKERVGRFVDVFFLPVFFAYTGLRTDIGSLADRAAWLWCAAVISIATLGKFGGCYLAARLAGLRRDESRLLGAMMNTRGLMELVVLNVGYDLRVIGPQMFTMLVLMAIASTVATSPLLRRWLPALGLWQPTVRAARPALR
ncbi:cation:proton antiporter [Eleftheria terrae]|uniref:cation:proton antiporter n=1 Tax=Eleftheria terrae TaxID=1597781 RepID=UPI00263A41C4|nr:cation:proton antiporter [Eleftheria terrae]WKB54189.1 cation:proton antiporter [Eleftheria terrae]